MRRVSPVIRAYGCVLVLGAAAVVSGGCGGPDASSSDRAVSKYQGRQADLFDDSIDPAAVGLDFDKGYAPKLDKTLRERTQTCDAILRVRVSTVTAKTDGPDQIYQLGMHILEHVGGPRPPAADFTVQIDKASEAHGIVKSFESRLVGNLFVAFVREFSVPGGERAYHFHLAPDSKEVRMAVMDALIQDEFKK